MKKTMASLMAVMMLASMSTGAFADSYNQSALNNVESVRTFTGEDGVVYEYVKYSDPVKYNYDGTHCTSLGKIRVKHIENVEPYSDYREWKEYEIVDYGILTSFVNMSKPYFAASVAKGEAYEKTVTKSVSIRAKVGVGIPSESQKVLNKALQGEFLFDGTGTYSAQITINLSGPEDENNTRTFYYKTGYHKHDITIIESRYSNWDGFMDSREYTGCYGYEPTYLSFSEDSYVK